jgi:hypothetical protein
VHGEQDSIAAEHRWQALWRTLSDPMGSGLVRPLQPRTAPMLAASMGSPGDVYK